MAEDHLPARVPDDYNQQNEAAPNDSIAQSARLFLLARRILLTSLGAIALTLEETNEFIERLIERGELAEHELNALVEDTANRGKSVLKRLPDLSLNSHADVTGEPLHNVNGDNGFDVPSAKSNMLGERVEGILVRLNVPSRSDIETLTHKIDVLSGKVLLLKTKSPPPQEELDPNAEAAETA